MQSRPHGADHGPARRLGVPSSVATIALAFLCTVSLAFDARAGSVVEVQLASGDSVRGTLHPEDDPDTFLLHVPAGAHLDVRLRRTGGGLSPVPSLADEDGGPVGEPTVRRRGVEIDVAQVAATGRYRLSLATRDSGRVAEYSLRVRWTLPRRVRVPVTATGDGGSVGFEADAGTTLGATLRAARGSDVRPRMLRLEGPGGFVQRIDAALRGVSGRRVRGLVLPSTGHYELIYDDTLGRGGGVVADLAFGRRRPRSRYDLTDRRIAPEAGEAQAYTRVVTAAGATITVGDGSGESIPIEASAGTSLTIPPGALPADTPVLFATSAVVRGGTRPGTDLVPVGPPITFGPSGLTLSEPATVTLPLFAGRMRDGDALVVLRRSDGGRTSRVGGGLLAAEGDAVRFAVRRLGAFQAFREKRISPSPQRLTAPRVEFATHGGFGFSVAFDGSSLAIGAPEEADGSGAVYVCRPGRDGRWKQLDRKAPPRDEEAHRTRLGYAIALDGGTLVASAFGCGEAWVFERKEETWSEAQRLVPSDGIGRIDASFGTSVALRGDTLLIGSPLEGDTEGEGAVYVFERRSGSWAQTQRLVPHEALAGSGFGTSVSLDGDTLVVGAPFLLHSNIAAYVYSHSSGDWVEAQALGEAEAGQIGLGVAVAVDGDTLVVGAGYAAPTAEAFIFERTNGTWNRTARLEASAYVGTAPFNPVLAVAIDDDTVAITSRQDAPSGAVNVFRREGGDWKREAALRSHGRRVIEGFGQSLALRGDTLVVGDLRVFSPGSGAAWVFTRRHSDWTRP